MPSKQFQAAYFIYFETQKNSVAGMAVHASDKLCTALGHAQFLPSVSVGSYALWFLAQTAGTICLVWGAE